MVHNFWNDIKYIFFVIILGGIVIGCSKSDFIDLKTPIEQRYSGIEYNKQIEIGSVYYWEEDKGAQSKLNREVAFGDEIYAELINNTNKYIRFPYDWGVYKYAFDESNSTWIEVEDDSNTVDGGPLILEPMEPEIPPGVFFVEPSFPSTLDPNSKDIPVRLVIIGTIIDQDTDKNEKVGAYIDLFLDP